MRRAEPSQAEFPLAQEEAAAKVPEPLAGRWRSVRELMLAQPVWEPSALLELEQRVGPSRVEGLPAGVVKARPVQAAQEQVVRVRKLNLRQLKLAGLAVSGTTGRSELARA